MMVNRIDRESEIPPSGGDVEELSLFLPSWQLLALAKVAELEGLTVAQFMRHLVKKAPILSQVS